MVYSKSKIRKQLPRFTVMPLAVSILASCASVQYSPPQVSDFEKSKTYNQNYEKTWLRVVEWFAQNDITIDQIDKESGLIAAKEFTVDDSYLDCGSFKTAGVSDSSMVRAGAVNVVVRDLRGRSSMSVNFWGEFLYTASGSGSFFIENGKCLSKGKLENQIISHIGM